MKRVLFLLVAFTALKAHCQLLPSYVPTSGLLAWYSFTGNANDLSGNAYHGTVHSATLTTDRFGNPGQAYLFNGTSSKITTSLLPPTGNGARTISCWFKTNGIANPCAEGNECIAGYGADTADCSQARKNFSLEVNYETGPIYPKVDGCCIFTRTSDPVTTDWHFFAAVVEPSLGDFYTIKLYVDGVYRSTSTTSFSGGSSVVTGAFSNFDIGAGHYSCKRFFDGKIDDIGVWDRALTAWELFLLYNSSMPAASSAYMSAHVADFCTDQQFTVAAATYSSSLTVITHFGDGASQTNTFAASTGCTQFLHPYASSGVYVVKHVLCNSGVPFDSVTYSHTYNFCRTMPIKVYHDADANCAYTPSAEPLIVLPSLLSVDSSGIVIDTISLTSGLHYKAYGPIGTVYKFRVVETAAGLVIACPTSGEITRSILLSSSSDTSKFGMACSATPGFDFRLFTSFRAGVHHLGGTILAQNMLCTPPTATITMHLSPKYTNDLTFIPTPASVSGTVVTWDASGLSSISPYPFLIKADMEKTPGVLLPYGDTVNTRYFISPLTGDANPSDNAVIRNDTVVSSYDPNMIEVSPSGCLPPANVKLTYTIHFENTGNAPAYNIYVLDTLSTYLDAASLRILAASAPMDLFTYKLGNRTVVRFDFPNINLPDSAHGQNTGMVVYSINRKPSLPDGTHIRNRVGIYFDDNPAVLTNTAENTIGCPIASVNEVAQVTKAQVHPNPTTNELIINSQSGEFTHCDITNGIGQTMLSATITGTSTSLDVKQLPAGVYYLMLRGTRTEVHKVVKL